MHSIRSQHACSELRCTAEGPTPSYSEPIKQEVRVGDRTAKDLFYQSDSVMFKSQSGRRLLIRLTQFG
jgi:hypothetical protein